MLDPIPVPPFLRDSIEPLTNLLHLHTLPLHIHEVLLSYTLFTLLNAFLAPYLSLLFLPTAYAQLSRRTQLQWNIHVTSFVNSTFVSVAALYVLFADRDRLSETWEERMWGYTGLGGMVQAFGAGYFVWDLQICAVNVGVLGVTDLLHAAVALSIAILGFVCRATTVLHIPFLSLMFFRFLLSSSVADLDFLLLLAPFWLVLRNTVRFSGAFHPFRQHPLVPKQIRQSRLNLPNNQRRTSHRNFCLLPACVGLLPHYCIFPRCVDRATCAQVFLDRVRLLAATAASQTRTSSALVACQYVHGK